MPFRTTISAVFWTDTVEEAEAAAELVKASIVDEEQDKVLVSISYAAERPSEVSAVPPEPAEPLSSSTNGPPLTNVPPPESPED